MTIKNCFDIIKQQSVKKLYYMPYIMLIASYIMIYFLQIIQSYSFLSTSSCKSNIMLLERWLFAGGITNSITTFLFLTLYKSYKATSDFYIRDTTLKVKINTKFMISIITPAYITIISFKITWMIFGVIIFFKDYYKCSSDTNTNTLMLVSLTADYYFFILIIFVNIVARSMKISINVEQKVGLKVEDMTVI